MDDLPYPDFSDYFEALERWAPHMQGEAPIALEFSRGCWWGQRSQCVFCGLNCQSIAYRRKSARRAEEEIKTLTDRYRVNKVILSDSILDMSYFKTLLPALAEWGKLEELFLEARINLTREQVGLLRAAGVTHFQPGIESLDSEMLALMGKGTTLLQNLQFLKWAREYGLQPTWNLLYGFPRENPEAYARMASLIPAITHLTPPMDVIPVLLVRFSPLFEHSQDHGVKNPKAHRGYRAVYPFAQEDLDGLAYFFDYQSEERRDLAAFIKPLKHQVKVWRQNWEQGRPPLLTFDARSNGEIVIYDSRPGSQNPQVILNGLPALVHSACETIQDFDRLAAAVREQMGAAYVGDAVVGDAIDGLLRDGLLVNEGDRFLSLASRPIQIQEVSEEW